MQQQELAQQHLVLRYLALAQRCVHTWERNLQALRGGQGCDSPMKSQKLRERVTELIPFSFQAFLKMIAQDCAPLLFALFFCWKGILKLNEQTPPTFQEGNQ